MKIAFLNPPNNFSPPIENINNIRTTKISDKDNDIASQRNRSIKSNRERSLNKKKDRKALNIKSLKKPKKGGVYGINPEYLPSYKKEKNFTRAGFDPNDLWTNRLSIFLI